MIEEAKRKIIERIDKTDDTFLLSEVFSTLEKRPQNNIDDDDIRKLFDLLIPAYKKVGKIPLSLLTPILSARTVSGLQRYNWKILTIDDLMLSDLVENPKQILKINFIGYKSLNELNLLFRYLKSIYSEN